MILIWLSIVDPEISNACFNDFCEWCIHQNSMQIERLLLFRKIFKVILISRTSDNQVDSSLHFKTPLLSYLFSFGWFEFDRYAVILPVHFVETRLTTTVLHSILSKVAENGIHLRYFECDCTFLLLWRWLS